MAKPKNPKAPNPSIPNKDLMQRLNYTHQISGYLEAVSSTQSGPQTSPLALLSRSGIANMRSIAKKAQIRLYAMNLLVSALIDKMLQGSLAQKIILPLL